MEPVASAFERLWPDAQRMNLLDDRLSLDLAERGALDAAMHARIATIARYAADQHASGILFTCSAFGAAIDAAAKALGVPMLKPNEAMFGEAIATAEAATRNGARAPVRVGLLTTFAPAGRSMAEEFRTMPGRQDDILLDSALAEGAMEALARGDAATHDSLIVASAKTLAHCDVIMLGQFSMARARERVAAVVPRPILSSPDSAVRAMQRLVHREH